MSESSEAPAGHRHARPNLRSATLILPRTGERVKKSFTLRRFPSNAEGPIEEQEPLLDRSSSPPPNYSRLDRIIQKSEDVARKAYAYATSKTGQGILKCSIAYVLGSLATFSPWIAALLGKNDGKHTVATIAVYFHPARSAGSMAEATMLAMIAFVYTAVLSFASMALSIFFEHQHLMALGHALVLVIFCGGGFGIVGWVKQRMGNPLVNVACSLASLALSTILTREGAVQAAKFSYDKVWQTLRMVIMGIFFSALVGLLVKPVSARKELRDNLRKASDSLGEMLTLITRGFLSGSEEELKSASYIKASNQNKALFKSLVKNLGEAKYEHYIVGTEQEYKIESRLIKCLERLTHNIGGLRSSAETQFTLISHSEGEAAEPGFPMSVSNSQVFTSQAQSPSLSPDLGQTGRRTSILASIEELPHESTDSEDDFGGSSPWKLPKGMENSLTAVDMFSLFIAHLGPAMKSLTYTIREVLDELPFGPGPEYAIIINSHFRSSLVEANKLYTNARKEALALLYENKIPSKAGSIELAADFEEVAASCGYFSSSLQDFAEDMIAYLDILDELKDNHERGQRTWQWLKIWRKWRQPKKRSAFLNYRNSISHSDEGLEHGVSHSIPGPLRHTDTVGGDHKPPERKTFSYRIWRALRFFRREDIKFALKVGIGAMIYSLASFIPATRATYQHWRGEWGLLSYMLVCSMTIGASNTTGYQRFLGTCLGAGLAVLAWVASSANPYALCFYGWLISLGCFYIIVGKGKGPMGRFIFLSYNLSCLYAYSLSVKDEEDDDDEGGISPEIWEIVLHRVFAVMTGCIWGIIITRLVYPISARRKIKDGICVLWLRMGLVWKRGPLRGLIEGTSSASYLDPQEELEMQRFIVQLDALRSSASSEFELKGPFPEKSYKRILDATDGMLDSFHAMNVIILKDLKASEGEKEILKYTEAEWTQLSWRISHLFTVLASSMKLQYPLNDVLPKIEHTRDRLLAKVFEFRKTSVGKAVATDEDYELLYAFALVTGQLAQDISIIGEEIEKLYGVLDEDNVKLE